MARKRIEELDKNLAPKKVEAPDEMQWTSASHKKFAVRGLPWLQENGGEFLRFPKRAEKIVRAPVWTLSQCPASANIAFRTDSTRLAVRFTIESARVMAHMPATGSNGLALYEGAPFQTRPWTTAVGDDVGTSFERGFFAGLPRQMREFRLYLPLYMALHKLEIGLDKGAKVLAPSPTAVAKPVVFYGTSITQGGCASTASTDFVSTIGRMLNIEAINLGFSGNGQGEPEVAELVSEIDASLFVLDYAANTDEAGLKRTLPKFCKILRAKHPETPILIVTNVCFSSYSFRNHDRSVLEGRRDAMLEYYLKARNAGDANIHFADGFSLIPFDADAAYVDAVHPSDHGFYLMAERLAPFIRQLVRRDPGV